MSTAKVNKKEIEACKKQVEKVLRDLETLVVPSNRFSVEWIRENFPDYTFLGSPRFHHVLCDRLNSFYFSDETYLAIAAPRGSAKSVIANLAFSVFAALSKSKYILIISDSQILANQHVSNLRPYLSFYSTLNTSRKIKLVTGTLIESVGTGSRVRGKRNGRYRPDLVIIDDPQSNIDLVSESERRYALEWLYREILPIGGPYTKFVCIGTTIHKDAIISRLVESWPSVVFPAIISWPKNFHLWEEYSRMAPNLREEFYRYHKDEMEDGAESIWPERWKIKELMDLYFTLGKDAFNAEYQQIPGMGVLGSNWDANVISSIIRDNFDIYLQPYRILAIDPAQGRTDKSDFQAYTLLGFGNGDDKVYVMSICEKSPNWLDRIVELIYKFRPDYTILEENATMGLLFKTLTEKLQNSGLDRTKIIGHVWHRLPKSIRIRDYINPYIFSNKLVVHKSSEELIRELYFWPNSEHDDALDSLALALYLYSQIPTK